MPKYDYNIVVIGAGSAGLVSAYIASAVKAKVALIEKHKMGGDCLNTGCVPSKALIRSTKILSYIKRHREFGLKSASAEFDFAEVMERVQAVIKKVEPHDSIERYSALGVDCITGSAKIVSPHEIRVNGKTLTTKNIIVATGARPAVPPIPGLDRVDYLTTDNLWDLRELPQRLVIAGGGPIGCELAQCFARLGSRVTQVEMMPDILIREDEEICRGIRERFVAEGVDVRINTKCKEIVVENGKQFMVCEKDGQEQRIEFDKVLIAVGRAANAKGFGLEEIGVELGPRGTVVVDGYLRTPAHKNIYACGDVAGPYQFTHTAAHQAWYCAVNALFSPFKKFRVDYRVIPWCTFTDPEVARVGLNEKDAKEQGIPYEVARYGIDDLDRAIADGEDHGMIKVLTEPGKDRVLGVTIMGYHAGDLITEYVAAMKHGFGLNKILGTIHIYPTMGEANKFAAGIWKKDHAPQGLLNWVQKFHAWRR
ncbi:pyridine nucleotide-disulfide oxidoreductase [Candidatus Nitromaritima sp. SCGC AAA799-C22]|nr:pyridine nucleotide-disulfide oxidoreductase [Candidatus Nitromaritima sp. SCGC AAA799-C22]